jgi:XTP/dITP diphosphohydrolase
MHLLFATTNPHKLDEVQTILGPLGIQVVGLDSLASIPPEPVEDADTFAGNARIKAVAYARAAGQMCLADDSGLEVDALNGAPGVHSAYYAGAGTSRVERDPANNARLLRELRERNIPLQQRTARFVCAMCLADERGNILAETRGEFPGLISDQPRGSNGFGYDPLLWLPDRQCTSAELSSEEKNARSHRGKAARLMVQRLHGILR